MMDFWYTLLALLPFDWASPQGMQFMKHAFLAVLLILPILALAGTMVVHHRMSFFSDALGHGAFTGVAAGSLAGLADLGVSSLLFAILFAVLMVWVQRRSGLTRDNVLGALAAFFVSLGLFLATWGGQDARMLTRFLLGDLLSVTPHDLMVAFIVLLVFLSSWIWLSNRLLLLGAAPNIAISRGLKPVHLEIFFAILLAILVSFSLQWLGLLTVNACLVLPAAAARQFAKNTRQHQWFTILLALTAGFVGLQLSWSVGTVAGASIVLVLSLVFLIGLFWRRP